MIGILLASLLSVFFNYSFGLTGTFHCFEKGRMSLGIPSCIPPCAITFKLNGGRLGDNLLNFIKSLWVAYTYGYDFLVTPFRYYDRFALSRYYTIWDDAMLQHYPSLNVIKEDSLLNMRKKKPALYKTTYYFCANLWSDWNDCTLWQGLYDNPLFRQIIRDALKPINPVKTISLPKNIPTVALHVRKGGGFDAPLLSKTLYADVRWPLKFPPDSYYINQLCYLSDTLGNIPLYVHIFTDDAQPEQLVKKYKKMMGNRPISFGHRRRFNGPNVNILGDLYSMAKCDYLIRPDSSYSKTAHLLGNHKMVIFPCTCVWKGPRLIITEVVTITQDGNRQVISANQARRT